MIQDPKNNSSEKDDKEPVFNPNDIIQSDPSKIQQNSIDDSPFGDYKPDINKSEDWGGSKGLDSISGLDD